MYAIRNLSKGILLSLAVAVPAYVLGKIFPIIGGPVCAILLGMAVALFLKDKPPFEAGIRFTSKKILQYAVILLGFGLDLRTITATGRQSLPIIIGTISTSLVIAFLLKKAMHIDSKTAVLVGVGSSVCGGSAIAAAAPCIDADDEEIAQAISVIFFFNVIAAICFPNFGALLGFDRTSGNAFGVFAGTAINDTSSVTAAASTWDSMFALGTATLDKAVTVKLTRTLAIIPITLVLAFQQARKREEARTEKINWFKVFPVFIIYFLLASVITTIAGSYGVDASFFLPMKQLSKFFIVLAMAAIGLNTNIIKLVKTGGKPILLGFACWIGITFVSLLLQHVMGIW
jgi:uncharacterized integral membrane protein (TIGR00698 family)